MIRIRKQMPKTGNTVIVRITMIDEQQQHTCELIEYGNMPGIICRVEVHTRDAANTFKHLTVGRIIPVMCAEDVTGDTKRVSLTYIAFDKETIDSYTNCYKNTQKIIAFLATLVGEHCEKDTFVPDVLLRDNDVVNIVQRMIDEISENHITTFFNDTNLLHELAKTWMYCNTIKNFNAKLLKHFPKIIKPVTIIFEYRNYTCNAVDGIKRFNTDIIIALNGICRCKIDILACPQYKLTIYEVDDVTVLQRVQGILKSYANDFCEINIL